MSNPSTPQQSMNHTLKRIGCAAAAFSGVAGAIYAVSTGIRKGDFSSALWAMDPAAAPPLSTQRQLREEDSGEEQPSKKHRAESYEARELEQPFAAHCARVQPGRQQVHIAV